MKVIQVISANKKTKQRYFMGKDEKGKDALRPGGYKSKIGFCQAIVEGPHGPETRHMVPMGGTK